MATYPVSGGDFKSVSAGMHAAVCVIVADLGLQPGNAQWPDPKPKVHLRFEVADEMTHDGKPLVIGTTFTASMGSKALLRKAIESWRGKKMTDAEASLFDVRKLLGQPCMLNVAIEQSGVREYANIVNIVPLMKGMVAPKPHAVPIYYGPEDESQFAQLPKYLQTKIEDQLKPKTASDREEALAQEMASRADDQFDDDQEIPF